MTVCEHEYDVVIVGGGPAGFSAATLLADSGLSVLIIDEQAQAGGQIFRQPPKQWKVSNWLSNRVYREGKAALRKAEAHPGIQWRFRSTVSGIQRFDREQTQARFSVLVENSTAVEYIQCRYLILATGCHDMGVAFPGSTLPGVMMAGGIQAFVKSQMMVPGEQFLFSGTHPLQLIVADQVIANGGKVSGVYFAQTLGRMLRGLKDPRPLLRFPVKAGYLLGCLWRLVRAGVPIRFGATVIEAGGNEQLSEVAIAPVNTAGEVDRTRRNTVVTERLGLCFSFVASSELARQLGAEVRWSAPEGGFLVAHDQWMQSTVAGAFVAGEITTVAGADAAMDEGRLAALGILRAEKLSAPIPPDTIRTRLKHHHQFATMLQALSDPGSLVTQLMSDDATLCKCESVSVSAINQCLQDNPQVNTASACKLMTRAGMGLCQGRYCQPLLLRLVAQQRACSEADVGSYTAQFPVKPVAISKLICAHKSR